jgi:hypothetical protein
MPAMSIRPCYHADSAQCYGRPAYVWSSNAWCGREVQSKMTQLQIFGYCDGTGHDTAASGGSSRSALLQRRRVQCGEIGLRVFDALGGRLLEPQAR